MRKIIIAGNWKMNKDADEAAQLVEKLVKNFKNKNKVEVVVCPPFTDLSAVDQVIRNTGIELGAQNMYVEDKGAFTGEISPSMLKSVGCKYVIIGHSERRQYFKESNEFCNQKIKLALGNHLIPIYCVGELLEEREGNITFDVIKKQIIEGLAGLSADALKGVVIAYEPVWAIGTGLSATPAQANEVHAFIRKMVTEISDQETAQQVTIQYGGSVKPENASGLMSQSDIDGALVGGAALKVESFLGIINY